MIISVIPATTFVVQIIDPICVKVAVGQADAVPDSIVFLFFRGQLNGCRTAHLNLELFLKLFDFGKKNFRSGGKLYPSAGSGVGLKDNGEF